MPTSEEMVNALLNTSDPQRPKVPQTSSVDWLQQYLPTSVGSWLKDAETEGLKRAGQLTPKNVAGEMISGAMSVLPGGPKRPLLGALPKLALGSRFAQEPPQAGFTPSQLRALLNGEEESLVNMWHETKSPMPENAGEHYRMVRGGYAKELDKLGLLRVNNEEELRNMLLERRLGGKMVQPTKPEIIE